MCPSLIQTGSKTAEKNSAQTNKHTNRHYENNGHLAVNQNYSIIARHPQRTYTPYFAMFMSFIDHAVFTYEDNVVIKLLKHERSPFAEKLLQELSSS